jgi:hypothetical protein
MNAGIKLECLSPGKNFKPSLMLASKAGAYKVEHLSVGPLCGRLLALSTNIATL